ncbi:MAG: hypothetical protein FJX68_17620 [Alphaproteobacteria bacterium]|nr:hypothetical protein [Alphaproteobacteria bacterium]
MKRLNAELVLDLVARTLGIELRAGSGGRAAGSGNAIEAALDAVAGHSLFDTEPAQFERELRRLRGESGDD